MRNFLMVVHMFVGHLSRLGLMSDGIIYSQFSPMIGYNGVA